MTDILQIDIPYFVDEPQRHVHVIKWCPKHWADLMHALNERGFGNQIAPDADALTEKFLLGEYDPCWDACNRINTGAMQLFGPQKVSQEHKGCPICAFNHIVDHVTDMIVIEHGSSH